MIFDEERLKKEEKKEIKASPMAMGDLYPKDPCRDRKQHIWSISPEDEYARPIQGHNRLINAWLKTERYLSLKRSISEIGQLELGLCVFVVEAGSGRRHTHIVSGVSRWKACTELNKPFLARSIAEIEGAQGGEIPPDTFKKLFAEELLQTILDENEMRSNVSPVETALWLRSQIKSYSAEGQTFFENPDAPFETANELSVVLKKATTRYPRSTIYHYLKASRIFDTALSDAVKAAAPFFSSSFCIQVVHAIADHPEIESRLVAVCEKNADNPKNLKKAILQEICQATEQEETSEYTIKVHKSGGATIKLSKNLLDKLRDKSTSDQAMQALRDELVEIN